LWPCQEVERELAPHSGHSASNKPHNFKSATPSLLQMNWPVEFFARKRAQNSSSKATVWGFSGAYRDQISAELIEYLLEFLFATATKRYLSDRAVFTKTLSAMHH
jgi:hypothetical protein